MNFHTITMLFRLIFPFYVSMNNGYQLLLDSSRAIAAVARGPTMFQDQTNGNKSEKICALESKNSQPIAQNMKNDIILSQIRRVLSGYAVGPERNSSYNPNLGYEPYWPGGEHVFIRQPSNNSASDRVNKTMCGSVCPTLFLNYGPVCGVNKHHRYKDFVTVCQLRNEDCTNDAVWTIAYRGKCLLAFATFPTRSRDMKARANRYIQAFLNRSLPTVDYKKEEWLQNAGSKEYLYAIKNAQNRRRAVRNNLQQRLSRTTPFRKLTISPQLLQ